MAARKKAKADPSETRRKSLDYLAAADNDINEDGRRRDMVARRLSYQHKSGTGIRKGISTLLHGESHLVFLKVYKGMGFDLLDGNP